MPVVRAAAHRAGQQPRALLHERHLPGADRAAAHPLGVARRGRHRRDRAEVDRAPQRGGQARQAVGLLRAHPRGAARVRRHRGRLRRPDDRVDRGLQAGRPAARARRARHPDGVRGHRGAAVPRRASAASRRSRRPARSSLQQVEDIGPKVAASLDEHLNRETTKAELERLRELRRRPRRARGGPAAQGGRRRAARGHDGRHHRLDRRPALGREGPAARRSSGCASARAPRRPRPSRPPPTC